MYIVNEYQTTNGVTAIVTPYTTANLNQAESAYHSKLASAAISSVEIHAVTLESDEGFQLKRECYHHDPVAAE